MSSLDATVDDTRRTLNWPAYFSGGGGVEVYMGGDYDRILDNFRKTYRFLGIAHRFMTENLPFWQMVSVDGLLTGESRYARPDGKEGDAEVFAKTGEVYAVYFPKAFKTGTLDSLRHGRLDSLRDIDTAAPCPITEILKAAFPPIRLVRDLR